MPTFIDDITKISTVDAGSESVTPEVEVPVSTVVSTKYEPTPLPSSILLTPPLAKDQATSVSTLARDKLKKYTPLPSTSSRTPIPSKKVRSSSASVAEGTGGGCSTETYVSSDGLFTITLGSG